MTARQIAIDGPAGAGKSTVAKRVAGLLGYLYIDTGAMYRAIALLALRRQIPFDDAAALSELAEQADLRLESAPFGCRVFLGGEDVSEQIRRPEVGNAASPVSAVPGVRTALVRRQQEMASAAPVVMDGRDIGTVVLPQADCKVFLTASLPVRAERRWRELREKGLPAELSVIEAEMAERDYRDSHRETSPLKQADDAVLLDSSDLDINQVVTRILELAQGAEAVL